MEIRNTNIETRNKFEYRKSKFETRAGPILLSAMQAYQMLERVEVSQTAFGILNFDIRICFEFRYQYFRCFWSFFR